MDVLDEAKVTNHRPADIGNEQDRVAEEKIEAERSMFSHFHPRVLGCSRLTASSQLPSYAGFFQTTQPSSTKTSVKKGTRALELGFSIPPNSSVSTIGRLGYSATGNV